MPGNIVQIDPTVVETKAAIVKDGKIVAPGAYAIAWTATYDDGSTTPLQMVLPDLYKRLNDTYGADKDGNLVQKGTTTKVTVDDIDAAIVAYMASGAKAPKKTYDEALSEAITQSDNTGVPWIVKGNSKDGFKAEQAGNPASGYEWARAPNGAWMQQPKEPEKGWATPEEARMGLNAFLEPSGGQYSPDVGKYEIVQDQDTRRWYYQQKPEAQYEGMTEGEAQQRVDASGGKLEKYYDSNADTWKLREAKAGAGPTPTITWKDGYGWYQSEVDGQWIRIDPKRLKSQFEDSIFKDFTEGREADALRKWDFLNQPTSMELAEFALQAAQSPADYFTIWAIARGEMPVQAQGPFGRIAPNAQWLDAALARLFQWTAGSGLTPDDVFKGANGQAGPQGNAATQNWDEIANQAAANILTGEPVPQERPALPSAGAGQQPIPYWSEEAEQQRATPAATVPFGGYPSDVAFPAEEGGGMTYTSQEPTPFTPIVRTGGRSMKGGLLTEDEGAIPTPDMGVTPAEPDIWTRYATSGQMPAQTPVQPRGRSSGLQYDVDTLGTEKPRTTVPFGAGWPTWMKNVYAGQTVSPVQRQFPAMGGPPFASPESLYNMLPSEREARKQAIKMQGIPWEDYEEQEQRATRPTYRTYRRSRLTTPFATVGRG